MSKPFNPGRQSVELRPSKIRREPPPAAPVRQTVLPDDSEREGWVVAIGVLAFALAITILIFWISDYTSSSGEPPAPITVTDAN